MQSEWQGFTAKKTWIKRWWNIREELLLQFSSVPWLYIAYSKDESWEGITRTKTCQLIFKHSVEIYVEERKLNRSSGSYLIILNSSSMFCWYFPLACWTICMPTVSYVASTNVCNTSQLSRNVCNTSQLSTNVCNTSQLSTNVYNTSQLSTNVFNTSQLSTNVCNTSQLSTKVCITSQLSTNVCNTSQLSTTVCNTSQLSTNMRNTSQLSTNVCNTSQLSTNVCNTSQLSTNMRNTSQLSTNVCNTSQLSTNVCKTSQLSNIDLNIGNTLHGLIYYEIGVTCVLNWHEIYNLNDRVSCQCSRSNLSNLPKYRRYIPWPID